MTYAYRWLFYIIFEIEINTNDLKDISLFKTLKYIFFFSLGESSAIFNDPDLLNMKDMKETHLIVLLVMNTKRHG